MPRISTQALKIQAMFVAAGIAMVLFGYSLSFVIAVDRLRLRAGIIALFAFWVVLGGIYSIRFCIRASRVQRAHHRSLS